LLWITSATNLLFVCQPYVTNLQYFWLFYSYVYIIEAITRLFMNYIRGICFCLFYLFTAFKYRDSRHDGRSLLEAESTIDEIRHHRSRRNVVLTNETDCQNNSLACKDETIKVSFIYLTLVISISTSIVVSKPAKE